MDVGFGFFPFLPPFGVGVGFEEGVGITVELASGLPVGLSPRLKFAVEVTASGFALGPGEEAGVVVTTGAGVTAGSSFARPPKSGLTLGSAFALVGNAVSSGEAGGFGS